MAKVCIIIPVYNTEKYLEQCLDSVISQTFRDIEIICINDGSTDKSPKILNDYACKDSRIRVIECKHQGVSISRNVGLKNANSDYIMYVDSDDWIESNCVEQCYNAIKKNNSDILIFSHRRISRGGNSDDSVLLADFVQNSNNIVHMYPFVTSIWNKIYKTSFIKENNLQFAPEISCDEDGIYNLMCLYKSPQISYLIEVLYNYRLTRTDSAIHTNNMVEKELVAFRYLINSNEYKNTDDTLKMFSISKFCFGLIYWYKVQQDKQLIAKNKPMILDFLYYLASITNPNILSRAVGFNALSCQIALESKED